MSDGIGARIVDRRRERDDTFDEPGMPVREVKGNDAAHRMADDERGRVVEAELAQATRNRVGVFPGAVAVVGSGGGSETEEVGGDEAMVLREDVEGATPVSARGEQSVEQDDRWSVLAEASDVEVGVVFARPGWGPRQWLVTTRGAS